MKSAQKRAIYEARLTAHGASFDGCHKIYIHMDAAAHEESIAFGYGDGTDESVLISVEDMSRDEMAETVIEWYENSCSLRFVHTVRGAGMEDAEYKSIIPQGGGDEG